MYIGGGVILLVILVLLLVYLLYGPLRQFSAPGPATRPRRGISSAPVTRTIDLPDGRSLELHELGDPKGFPIVYHHGTPGSGTLYSRWETEGVRLVAYDRAGYAGSTRRPGR